MSDSERQNYFEDSLSLSESNHEKIKIRKIKNRTVRKSSRNESLNIRNIKSKNKTGRPSSKSESLPESESLSESVKIIIRKKSNKFLINAEEVIEQIFNCVKDIQIYEAPFGGRTLTGSQSHPMIYQGFIQDLAISEYYKYQNDNEYHKETKWKYYGKFPQPTIVGADALKKHISVWVKGVALLAETKPGFLRSINAILLKIKKAYDELENIDSIRQHYITKLGRSHSNWQGPMDFESAWYRDVSGKVEVLKKCLDELFTKINTVLKDANELRTDHILKYHELVGNKGAIYNELLKISKERKTSVYSLVQKEKDMLVEKIDIYNFLRSIPVFHNSLMPHICTVINHTGNNFTHLSQMQDTCVPNMRKYTKCILSMFNNL